MTHAPGVEGRLLIATTNRDKLREIRSVLAGTPVELLTLADLPPADEPDETGATFAENARLKARHYADAAGRFINDPGLLIVGEDSGLVVDALDGGPCLPVALAEICLGDTKCKRRFSYPSWR